MSLIIALTNQDTGYGHLSKYGPGLGSVTHREHEKFGGVVDFILNSFRFQTSVNFSSLGKFYT